MSANLRRPLLSTLAVVAAWAACGAVVERAAAAEPSGRKPLDLAGHTGGVSCAAFSADGKRIAAADGDGVVHIWDADAGVQVGTVNYGGLAHSLAFSPDGKRLAVAGEKGLRVYDAAGGRELLRLRRKPAGAPNVPSPAGKNGEVTLHFLKVEYTIKNTGEDKEKPPDPEPGTRDTAAGDIPIQWDYKWATGHATMTGNVHYAFPEEIPVRASPEDGGTVVDYRATIQASAKFDNAGLGLDRWTGVECSGNTDTKDSTDIESFTSGTTPTKKATGIVSLMQRSFPLDFENLPPILEFGIPYDLLARVRGFSEREVNVKPVYKVVVVPPKGAPPALPDDFNDECFAAAWSPDGTRLAAGGYQDAGPDGKPLPYDITIWNAVTGESAGALSGHTGKVLSVAFSPDQSRLVSLAADKTAKIWDVAGGRAVASFDTEAEGGATAFSRDGHRAAAAYGFMKVRVWDVQDLKEVFTLDHGPRSPTSLVFAADGQSLVAAGPGPAEAHGWDLDVGDDLLNYSPDEMHDDRCAALSPEGRRVAFGDADGTLRVRSLPLPPVVFLPGVAGSQLYSGGSAIDNEVWPTAALGSRRDLALHPDGETPADGSARIVVGDILRFPGLTNFYRGLIAALKDQGYVEYEKGDKDASHNLFIFPYDWRLDNEVHLAELDAVIDRARDLTHQPKVVLLAHSMGGSIARAYVYSGPKAAAKVRAFITLDTPYWGAPKVYYGLIDGYQFGNPVVRQELMKVLTQNFPAAYELLPQYPFLYDAAAQRNLTPQESNGVRYKWFKGVDDHWWRTDTFTPTETNDQAINPVLLEKARKFYLSVGAYDHPTPLPAGVRQYAVIGCGVRTLSDYRVRDWKQGAGESYLELAGGRKVVLEPGFSDGDGTVPKMGLLDEAATATYFVLDRDGASAAHGDMPANPEAQRIVRAILDGVPPEPIKDPFTKRNKDLEPGVDFTLHSDAHLRIEDEAGRALGYNDQGGIDESLPSGTFLYMDGVEYASAADLGQTYKVRVVGTNEGKFHLTIKVAKDGKATTYAYPEVAVARGAVATVEFKPGAASGGVPPLAVNRDGQTTLVSAHVEEPAGGETPPATTADGRPLLVGGAVAAALLTALVAWFCMRRVWGRRPAKP